MTQRENLCRRRNEILKQLVSLPDFRRGSVVNQFIDSVRKDGSSIRRGPYPVYSFKEKGKTVSRRLKDPQEVDKYQKQIQAFRQFQAVIHEWISLSEQICDLPDIPQKGQKKTT